MNKPYPLFRREGVDRSRRFHEFGVAWLAIMNVTVQCYSGRKADERPVRFQLDGRDYQVEEVVDEWYGPDSLFFKVRVRDGDLYILRRRMFGLEDKWSLESFRSQKR